MVSLLKPHIGIRSTPYYDQIALHRISAFCKAVGIQESPVAPPTFMTVFRKGEFELFQRLGIELSRILHTEQEYEFERPIHMGETLYFQTVMNHVLEKQTSSHLIQFATFETTFEAKGEPQNGLIARVGRTKTMIVIRHPAAESGCK